MSSRTRWILLVIVVLATVGLLISSGHQRDDDPEPTNDPETGSVSFPMPERAPAKPLAERARGLYVLEGSEMRFTLDLRAGSAFHFVSTLGGKPRIEAWGTWSLAGTRLTLAYTRVTGRPTITVEEPEIAVNLWLGKTIELQNTGLKQRIVLTKRTALRQR